MAQRPRLRSYRQTTLPFIEVGQQRLELRGQGRVDPLRSPRPQQRVTKTEATACSPASPGYPALGNFTPADTRRLVQRFARHSSGTAALHRDLASLTPRELEVLGLPARGLSNAELATRLHLAEATVKTHVARILARLGLRDRVQAVIVAYETGLVSTGAREATRPE